MRSKLQVKNLSKSLGGMMILTKVNLTLGEGEIFGLLGPKGAGKTALLQMLGGMTVPDRGLIWIDEMPAADDWNGYKAKIGYLPDRIGFYENMTARENLRLFGDLYSLPIQECKSRMTALLKEVGLDHLADQQVKDWSPSQLQRLGLAKTLLHDPMVVIFDDPEQNLDFATKKIFRKLVTRLAREGKTVILSSEELGLIYPLCTSVGVLVHGELYLQGDVAAFQRRLRDEIHKAEIRVGENGGSSFAAMLDFAHAGTISPDVEVEELNDVEETINLPQLSREIQSFLIQYGLEIIDVWEETITVLGRLQAETLSKKLAEEGFPVTVHVLEPTEEEQLGYLCTRLQWSNEGGEGFDANGRLSFSDGVEKSVAK